MFLWDHLDLYDCLVFVYCRVRAPDMVNTCTRVKPLQTAAQHFHKGKLYLSSCKQFSWEWLCCRIICLSTDSFQAHLYQLRHYKLFLTQTTNNKTVDESIWPHDSFWGSEYIITVNDENGFQFDGTSLVILTTQSSLLSQSPAGQTHSSNTTQSPTFLLSSCKIRWNKGSRWTVLHNSLKGTRSRQSRGWKLEALSEQGPEERAAPWTFLTDGSWRLL